MCCEGCPKYEKCQEEFKLKEHCCPKCPDYDECVGLDDRDKDSYRDPNGEDEDFV